MAKSILNQSVSAAILTGSLALLAACSGSHSPVANCDRVALSCGDKNVKLSDAILGEWTFGCQKVSALGAVEAYLQNEMHFNKAGEYESQTRLYSDKACKKPSPDDRARAQHEQLAVGHYEIISEDPAQAKGSVYLVVEQPVDTANVNEEQEQQLDIAKYDMTITGMYAVLTQTYHAHKLKSTGSTGDEVVDAGKLTKKLLHRKQK